MRVVLDTNIFVSALEFGGIPLHRLEQARAGEFEVAISTPIVDEIKRVLREKFGWPESRLEQFERNVKNRTLTVFRPFSQRCFRIATIRPKPSNAGTRQQRGSEGRK
jgi:predicted nucleic acid-binding protein